jgi:hypothetical protein
MNATETTGPPQGDDVDLVADLAKVLEFNQEAEADFKHQPDQHHSAPLVPAQAESPERRDQAAQAESHEDSSLATRAVAWMRSHFVPEKDVPQESVPEGSDTAVSDAEQRIFAGPVAREQSRLEAEEVAPPNEPPSSSNHVASDRNTHTHTNKGNSSSQSADHEEDTHSKGPSEALQKKRRLREGPISASRDYTRNWKTAEQRYEEANSTTLPEGVRATRSSAGASAGAARPKMPDFTGETFSLEGRGHDKFERTFEGQVSSVREEPCPPEIEGMRLPNNINARGEVVDRAPINWAGPPALHKTKGSVVRQVQRTVLADPYDVHGVNSKWTVHGDYADGLFLNESTGERLPRFTSNGKTRRVRKRKPEPLNGGAATSGDNQAANPTETPAEKGSSKPGPDTERVLRNRAVAPAPNPQNQDAANATEEGNLSHGIDAAAAPKSGPRENEAEAIDRGDQTEPRRGRRPLPWEEETQLQSMQPALDVGGYRRRFSETDIQQTANPRPAKRVRSEGDRPRGKRGELPLAPGVWTPLEQWKVESKHVPLFPRQTSSEEPVRTSTEVTTHDGNDRGRDGHRDEDQGADSDWQRQPQGAETVHEPVTDEWRTESSDQLQLLTGTNDAPTSAPEHDPSPASMPAPALSRHSKRTLKKQLSQHTPARMSAQVGQPQGQQPSGEQHENRRKRKRGQDDEHPLDEVQETHEEWLAAEKPADTNGPGEPVGQPPTATQRDGRQRGDRAPSDDLPSEQLSKNSEENQRKRQKIKEEDQPPDEVRENSVERPRITAAANDLHGLSERPPAEAQRGSRRTKNTRRPRKPPARAADGNSAHLEAPAPVCQQEPSNESMGQQPVEAQQDERQDEIVSPAMIQPSLQQAVSATNTEDAAQPSSKKKRRRRNLLDELGTCALDGPFWRL